MTGTSPPSVSVVMPAHNARRYIAYALNSIFAQQYATDRLQVLVVDDGSTDDTAEIARRYEPRIRLIRQACAGPAAARNTALREARGEFIAFLDADDLWHPRKLAIQVGLLQHSRDLDFSICNTRNFWNGDPRESNRRVMDRYQRIYSPGIIMQSVVIRRPAMDEIGYFDENFHFGEDTDWFVRAGQKKVRHHLTRLVLGYRRVHETNMTANFREVAEDTMFKVLRASVRRHRAGRQRT